MKLIRFGEPGREAPGLLLDHETRLDVSSFVGDYDEEFFADGGLSPLKKGLNTHASSAPHVAQSVSLGSPISRPSKIVCIGLNFRDHAKESEMEIPKEPVIFFKATPSLVRPNDNLMMPKNARKVDWADELAVVIGKKGSYLEREDALEHSERVFQLERGRQWVKGKSADTFAPLGLFLATRDEIPNTSHLGMWLR